MGNWLAFEILVKCSVSKFERFYVFISWLIELWLYSIYENTVSPELFARESCLVSGCTTLE